MRLPRVRAALAVATVLLLLLGAAAPHVHTGVLGAHACLACAAAAGEEAVQQVPDLAPRPLPPTDVGGDLPAPPVTGVALGAIPGQSPPVA